MLTYLVGLQFTLQNANASAYWGNLNKKGLVYTKQGNVYHIQDNIGLPIIYYILDEFTICINLIIMKFKENCIGFRPF
jgi:hypothetical protein